MITTALFFAIFVHLFLVASFEVVFYFKYATKVELDVTLSMVDNACKTFAGIINNAVTLRTPSVAEQQRTKKNLRENIAAVRESIQASSDKAKREQEEHNKPLTRAGGYMLAGLAGFSVLLYIIVRSSDKNCVDWKHMIKENILVLFGFIIYDFIFFGYVVRNHKPISTVEFQYIMLRTLIEQLPCSPHLMAQNQVNAAIPINVVKATQEKAGTLQHQVYQHVEATSAAPAPEVPHDALQQALAVLAEDTSTSAE